MTKPLNVNVKEKRTSVLDLNKELENNIKEMNIENNDDRVTNSKDEKQSQFFKRFNGSFIMKYFNKLSSKRTVYFKNQQSAFRGASMPLILIGWCIGLNPVTGALSQNVSLIRFQMISIKHLFSLIMCLLQLIITILCLINNARSVTLQTLAYLSFYSSTFITTILFLRLARKWQYLNKEIVSLRLDEYIDQRIHFKCFVAAFGLLILALFEHLLSIISRYTYFLDCSTGENVFKMYIEKYFHWIFQMNIEYSTPIGMLIIILNVFCTMNWNYSHLFIICISLYLSSILDQINKKLISTEGQFLPPSFWKSLREDYNNATRLVRVFDDNINTIIFVSFASNLFFVCLQLFFVLSNGIFVSYPYNEDCPNYPSGPFNGYETVIYLTFSLAFVLTRSLIVSLIASKIHAASLVAAPVLYAVPSPAYCVEVQRFIEQVHGETVALTGMNFFHVTRELVLSVAGTIVTYELVLLQFT